MKPLILAALLLSPIPAFAASPEDAYIAARDSAIAAFKKTADTKAVDARNAKESKARKDLELKLMAIVGPFGMKGFPTKGKINLDTLFSEDEGFGMLDGILYGEAESAKNVVVTTDGLLQKWLLAHRNWVEGQTNPPVDPAAAVKSEVFYTQAVSTDSAVVHYAEIPIPTPDSAKFAFATLSAHTQDQSPSAPDEIFVALERGGRVFIVNEKLDAPMPPIAACDEVTKSYQKKAEDADKAYAASDRKDEKLADASQKLRDEGDGEFRRCYGDKVKALPSFKAASDQARAILEALPAK
jgi:hypothetical protein